MRTSKPEQLLLEELKKTFPNVLSGYVVPDVRLAGKHLITVDCFIPSEKTVVEFDGFYWHKKRKRADQRKAKMLTRGGYRVVRVREITSDATLPTLEVESPLFLAVDYLQGDSFDQVIESTLAFINGRGPSPSTDL